MRTALVCRALIVAVPLAWVATAHSQGQKPGLWETKTTIHNAKMDEAMAKMQNEMANMPPEQRQMMQDMMAKRGVGMAGNAMTAQVCITKEQAAKGGVPHSDPNCQYQELSRSSTAIKFSYTCTGPHAGSGSGEITFPSPTSYTMHSVSDQVIEGKPQHVDMNVAGNWVSDDCGAVKPFAGPATH
jgi:hypothetical protein